MGEPKNFLWFFFLFYCCIPVHPSCYILIFSLGIHVFSLVGNSQPGSLRHHVPHILKLISDFFLPVFHLVLSYIMCSYVPLISKWFNCLRDWPTCLLQFYLLLLFCFIPQWYLDFIFNVIVELYRPLFYIYTLLVLHWPF